MDYFYTTPNNISLDSLIIDGEEFSHLTHVMRKVIGDQIRVVDGKGKAYDVEIEVIKAKTAVGKIIKSYQNHNETEIRLTLAVGTLKNPSKYDFIVEKVTEIGVHEIVPLKTERTISTQAKIDRWQKLAIAAMKQCGRSYLPKIADLVSLNDFLSSRTSFEQKFISHEKPMLRNNNIITLNSQSVVVLIGPEGGFSDEEVEGCIRSGYQPFYFGERRLRTETAAIVAATRILIK